MDIPQRQPGSIVETYPWTSIVIYAAQAHYFIEFYINWRQLRLLRRQAPPTLAKAGLHKISDGQLSGWARTVFRITISLYFTLQVIGIISLNGIPKLWHLAAGVKVPYSWEHLGLEEFWRSYLFLIFCWLGYLILNLPTFLYRYYAFKENVVRELYLEPKNRNWIIHYMANGYPMPAVLFLVTMTVLEYRAMGKKIDGQYVILVGILQLAYIILYPIFMLPRAKTLSLLEPGKLKESLEELAKTVGFPLKNIYVVDNVLYDARAGLQASGWPRKTYIVIHKSFLEEYPAEDIVALVAQEFGCWKFSNGMRVFVVGQMYFTSLWAYLMLFLKRRVVYEAFGFKDEYPMVAGIALFTLGIAPWLSQLLRVQINYMGRKNCFMADNYAAELGYSSALRYALTRTATNADLGEVDMLYSLFHNSAPQLSERLAALEKMRKEQDIKQEGLVVFTTADEKV